MEWVEGNNILDVQEDYVDLFDRTPSLSLHLFEHIHGDSRERGQALVSLNELYTKSGLMISTEEMPDFLPLFLEYLSILPMEEAQSHLSGAINVLAAIGERLRNRGSDYASVFDAMEEVSSQKPDTHAVKSAVAHHSGKKLSPDELDQEWAEQFAFENTAQATTGGGECPVAQDMVSRMNRPIDPPINALRSSHNSLQEK
jgi:nitrate reductase delta subunit